MVPSLSTLTCFKHIRKIVPINAGLSSQCYQVFADNNCFFAKKLTTKNESTVSLNTASQHISPKVIYYDGSGLITQFIDSESLPLTQKTLDEKIIISIELMVKCHQLNLQPATLQPEIIINDLINQPHFSNQQKQTLLQQAKPILMSLNHTENIVCCHGDVNFSNVLIENSNKAWLVDYECAYNAPAEFDLAMFIAVNNIADNKIPFIIEQYKKRPPSLIIDTTRLSSYLIFAYFINSLWYKNAYQSQRKNKQKLLTLHKQQWKKFSQLSNSHAK
mgnify:CR=1 FL=1